MADGSVAGDAAYLQGKPCPKCAYVRAPADAAPAWQYPNCHIAYLKYPPGAAPLRTRLAASGRELAAEARTDHSAYLLIATNLFALGIAWWAGMSLLELMLVYWIQSLIIGASFFVRILGLKRFSVEQPRDAPSGGSSFWFRDASREDTFWRQFESDEPASKKRVAIYFIVGYVVAHLVYLGFMVGSLAFVEHAQASLSSKGLVLCALAFALNHVYSLIHNIIDDRRGRPNLRTLWSLPYYRVIPMHITIVMGGLMSGGTVMMIVFVILKTIADVVMHTVEHHVLRKDAVRVTEA